MTPSVRVICHAKTILQMNQVVPSQALRMDAVSNPIPSPRNHALAVGPSWLKALWQRLENRRERPSAAVAFDTILHGTFSKLGERFRSGDGERNTLLTRQKAFESLPASVLFAFGWPFVLWVIVMASGASLSSEHVQSPAVSSPSQRWQG